MKTLNEYMAIPYSMEIVEDQDEGGYVVSFPDLPGCLTCGEKLEQAVENAEDPFFSENNMQRLRRSAAQLEETGGTVHEIDPDD